MRRRRPPRSAGLALFACLLLFILAAPAGALGKRAVATGTGGAVASDTVQATHAGLAVLAQGGTAADAAVAVASTLGVTDPFVAGIGGGGYFVYYDARTHRVYTIDGRETAPAADNSSLFIDPTTGKPLPFPTAVTSGLSVGVPGTLMTWQRALSRWGRFALADDLKPAELVARLGFSVTPTLREQVRENAFRFDQFSSTSALFLPHGQLPVVGSKMRNPDLARTYAVIARRGVDAFYGGAIGRDVVRTVHNLPLVPGATLVPRPGAMTLADLVGYRALFRAPPPMSAIAAMTSTRWRPPRAAVRRSARPSTSCRTSISGRRAASRCSITTWKPRAWPSPIATVTWATPPTCRCRWPSCSPPTSGASARA